MRRAFAILKFFPSVLCGLLVVAWVVSLWLDCEFTFQYGSGFGDIAFSCSTVTLRLSADSQWHDPNRQGVSTAFEVNDWEYGPPVRILGAMGSAILKGVFYLHLPIPLILSLFGPLGVGLITRFRSPLWFYFAWTALIAAELAYYLR